MLEDGLRWRPVLAEQDWMEGGPTQALLDAADSGEEGDDGTFFGHPQIVPHDCDAGVAFETACWGTSKEAFLARTQVV